MRMPRFLISLARLLAISRSVSAGWNIELSITTETSGAVGGEPFADQPIVTVNDKKGNKQHSILGTVWAEIYESPTGHEDLLEVGVDEVKERYSSPVVDGEARFSGLFINVAGRGYRLRYILRDEHDITLGSVVGEPFSVEIGNAYQIGVVANPESAYGGMVWGTQPIVAVQDRGFKWQFRTGAQHGSQPHYLYLEDQCANPYLS